MSRSKVRKRVAKDPFHQQILEALEKRHLDSEVFEACMEDLLRDDLPGFVAVPGGNDAGMDGAFADEDGDSSPLVCTTSATIERIKRNLKKSLDSFVKHGFSSRKVALATSSALTPQETRALIRVAAERGFTLPFHNVFERSALASRLYRDSASRKTLLGLTGAPSALSVVPLSRRSQVDIELRGRDEDVAWLRSTSGDRVVSGLPGSGKTYLFSSLIRSGWSALFLVSADDTAIANAVREQEPRIVIVDDAHVEPDRLVRLRRLREEIQGEFEIVAATWPGARDEVVEAMGGLPESRIHSLGLLSRPQILEIFHDLDVRPGDKILRELVSQAGNKPGLAVTIALLWQQGEWQKIFSGTVLSRTVRTFFKGLTDGDVTDVLAAFSLGGRWGMSQEAVARFLEISPRDIYRTATDLATGGVLSPVDPKRLAVHPQVLRSALLRQVFFTDSPIRLDYRSLLPLAPSFAETVGEIVAARAYGAVVPTEDIHQLVLEACSRQAWLTLVMVSEEEARWVLENYPGDILDIASSLLQQIPRAVIPRILLGAAEAAKTGIVRIEQPMNILSAWVEEISAGPDEWIRRRRMLARGAKEFLLEGGERGIGVHVICIAMSPNCIGNSLDPGREDVLTEARGLLPSETLRQIQSIWDEAKDAIQVDDVVIWRYLESILWEWIFPHSAGSKEDAAAKRELMRGFSGRILKDIAPHSACSPGLRAALERVAKQAGISLELEQNEQDAILRILYPDEPARGGAEATQRVQIKALATKWDQDGPRIGIESIAFYEKEAQRKSYGGLPNMIDFCWELASNVQEPESWLDESLSQGLPGVLMEPFLERIVREGRKGWRRQLKRCLAIESLSRRAATLVLTLPDPPPLLFKKVLDEFSDLTTLVKERSQNRGIPVPTLRRLLCHSQWETALAAAVGEWWAEPQGEVRAEILPEWRSAILRSKTDEYSDAKHTMVLQYLLGCALSRDPDLALEWLRSRLRDPDLPGYFMEDSPFAHALRSLRKDQRLALLQELGPARIAGYMIQLLIREDSDVYRQLLSLRQLSSYHLAPLRGLPQKGWSDLALVALQAGYEPTEIAGAAFDVPHVWQGTGIEYWEKWDMAFAEVGREENPELQEISWHGRAIAHKKLEAAQEREQGIDFHGLFSGR